jgi:hypothetical protein
MKKILFIGSVLITSLLADNSLGTPIKRTTIDKVIARQTITTETIAKQTPIKTYTKSYTKTVVPKKTVTDTHSFKTDHHRYDKRYRDFDYDNNAYYNDDGYYYGYYNDSGYFYNNIFFTYNNNYTYEDRRYRRGYFIPRHRHNRTYRHHRVNDWNRIHCYREPDHIVYGHYYDSRHYPSRYRQNYRYRDNARVTIPRRNYNTNQSHSRSSITNYNTRRYNDNQYNNRNYNSSTRSNNNRSYNSSRDYNRGATMQINRNISSTQHRSTPKRTSAPKQHRASGNSGSAHMQMSK